MTYRARFQGRGHYYDSQISPLSLQTSQQRQCKITVKMPLMELIQHDGRYAR